ncbi:MAG: hypothetical protein RLZZ385_2786 [Pseudomonadota bacterium]|jgi:hypothetical protein
MEKYLLRNRYTLLASVIAAYILIIVIEGVITDRQTRDFTFENPYFELDLNNLEGLEQRLEGLEDDPDN